MHLSNLEWLAVALIVVGILCVCCTPWAPRGIEQHINPPVTVPDWWPMTMAPRDGTEFWALCDDTRGNDLPPFVSKCAWHPSAGFCTDELREPIMWRPL